MDGKPGKKVPERVGKPLYSLPVFGKNRNISLRRLND